MNLSNHFYLINGTIYNFTPTYSPILPKHVRPKDAICPVCVDKWRAFYMVFPPENSYRHNCAFCSEKGLHPIPLTEFYDEISYDAVDLP